MIDWYLTREGANIIHKDVPIPPGKKIKLSTAQAALHRLNKTTPPDSPDECGLPQEYEKLPEKDEP